MMSANDLKVPPKEVVNPFKKLPPARVICNICTTRWAGFIQIKRGDDHIVKPCNKCFQKMMKEQRWAQRDKEIASALRVEIVDKAGDPINILLSPDKEKFRVFTQICPKNPAHKEYPGFNKILDTRKEADAEFERVVKLIKEDKPLTEEKDNVQKDKPADDCQPIVQPAVT